MNPISSAISLQILALIFHNVHTRHIVSSEDMSLDFLVPVNTTKGIPTRFNRSPSESIEGSGGGTTHAIEPIHGQLSHFMERMEAAPTLDGNDRSVEAVEDLTATDTEDIETIPKEEGSGAIEDEIPQTAAMVANLENPFPHEDELEQLYEEKEEPPKNDDSNQLDNTLSVLGNDNKSQTNEEDSLEVKDESREMEFPEYQTGKDEEVEHRESTEKEEPEGQGEVAETVEAPEETPVEAEVVNASAEKEASSETVVTSDENVEQAAAGISNEDGIETTETNPEESEPAQSSDNSAENDENREGKSHMESVNSEGEEVDSETEATSEETLIVPNEPEEENTSTGENKETETTNEMENDSTVDEPSEADEVDEHRTEVDSVSEDAKATTEVSQEGEEDDSESVSPQPDEDELKSEETTTENLEEIPPIVDSEKEESVESTEKEEDTSSSKEKDEDLVGNLTTHQPTSENESEEDDSLIIPVVGSISDDPSSTTSSPLEGEESVEVETDTTSTEEPTSSPIEGEVTVEVETATSEETTTISTDSPLVIEAENVGIQVDVQDSEEAEPKEETSEEPEEPKSVEEEHIIQVHVEPQESLPSPTDSELLTTVKPEVLVEAAPTEQTRLPDLSASVAPVDPNAEFINGTGAIKLVEATLISDLTAPEIRNSDTKNMAAYILLGVIAACFICLILFLVIRKRTALSERLTINTEDSEKALMSVGKYKEDSEDNTIKNNEINPLVINKFEKNQHFSSPKNLNTTANEKNVEKDNVLKSTQAMIEDEVEEEKKSLEEDKCVDEEKTALMETPEKLIVSTRIDQDSIPRLPVIVNRNGNGYQQVSQEIL